MICSPSSLVMMRMIPCMAGCAGPTLRSISRVSSCSEQPREVWFGSGGGMARGMAVRRCRCYQGLAPVDRVVFSERMANELLVHENPLQVRMSSEADAEHVTSFPLEPVG